MSNTKSPQPKPSVPKDPKPIHEGREERGLPPGGVGPKQPK